MRASPHGPVLVLGCHGQLGRALVRTFGAAGNVVGLGRSEADLADPASVRAAIRRYQPCVVANAAAYTAVDRAESEPELAQAINGDAPRLAAEEAARIGALMIHFSTDYVFDGMKAGAYLESDSPQPLSAYGRSKLAGEEGVRTAGSRYLVFRTSWVFSAEGSNFLKTILGLAQGRESLRVVADQVGAPTSVDLIAHSVQRVVASMADASDSDPRWGTYHLCASGHTTWHGYAMHVVTRARSLGMPVKATPDSIAPIATCEYPVLARRPLNSRLDTSKIQATFGLKLPNWIAGVDDVVAVLATRT